MIRYLDLKALGNLEHTVYSVRGTVFCHYPVTCWADNALWPLDVTLAFNVACFVPASKPLSIFIRQISQTPSGELCGSSLLCNRSRLHCDTCQSGRKWRSDSLNYLSGNTPPHLFPPSSLFLPEINLLLNLWCNGHLPHQGERWILRQGSNLTHNSDFMKLKDDSGADGDEGLNCHVKVSSALIQF